ncbi:MAG: hypothetical protein P4M12_04810 [Gammaproteobacteria bacterium]|nr:hypothetical protein [Gammaproteobacteria bacterium]
MASSGSNFSSASSSSSSSVAFFSSVPSLKELAATQLVNQLGSVPAVEEFILQRPGVDMKPLLGEALERLQYQVNTLLVHVVKGDQKEAEELIKVNPKLLLSKGMVVDYSDRSIEGTAFQMALGAEDVKYHEDEECMAEMIQRYLRQLPDGELEIQKQIQEQFPEGWEAKENERAKNDLAALNKVVNAISVSQPNDNCEAALNEFREYLKPNCVIKTGKHFNAQLLVEAFKLYDKNYDRFGDYNSHKNILCWRKVIGYIQRFLPASYAQAFVQGVYYIVESGEKLNRSLKFRYENDVSFFPLDSDPSSRLGFDFAAWGGGGTRLGLCIAYVGAGSAFACQTLSSKKHLRCKSLCNVQTVTRRIAV